jgi:signal transduction histidine kinase
MLHIKMRHVDGPIYEQLRDTRTPRPNETGESVFMERHLEAVSRVDAAARLFLLVQVSGHTGLSLAWRREHIETLRRYPVVGAAAIVGANTTIGRPLAWFLRQVTGTRYRFFDERAPALAWLQEYARAAVLPVVGRAAEPGHADEQRATSELLLERIARITWDPTHDAPPLNLPPDDPLSLVAGAVDVLREDVVEMLAERQDNLEELAHRDGVLRETLADLAHDVRTPLTSLKLGLDGLRAGRDPEAIGQVLRAEVEHVEILFHNLSTLMQLGASNFRFAPHPTDMAELCERIALRFDVLARDKGVSLKLDLSEQPVWLSVDSLAVAQAVGNIVHNAIKYARGTVALSLRSHDRSGVEILAEDDGEGMAGLDVPSLLQRYTRGPRGVDEERSGSGLGLAIAKAIMVAHGGELAVGETVAGGARVRLRFPETLRVASARSELSVEG